LVDFARANIGYGGTAIDSQQDIELLAALVQAEHIDLVSSCAPSVNRVARS
jgi:hypothetical protein